MARETKAQRLAREAQKRTAFEAEQQETYPQRLMAMLERANKVNYELEVRDAQFVVVDRDDRNNNFRLTITWSAQSEVELYHLEVALDFKEESERDQRRQRELRRQAFAKLSSEEQQALGLSSEFNW
jgi:hypothetical protein